MKKEAINLNEIKQYINNLETNFKYSFTEDDPHFSINEIKLPSKIRMMLAEDYYKVNLQHKYPAIPASLSINEIILQYLKSKITKYNLIMKKNDIIHKCNPHIQLITSVSNEEPLRNVDLDIQMIYINDIINMLKGFMIMSVNSIVYSSEEKSYTFNILDNKEEGILNLLGVPHLLRFIVQTPYIVKFFHSNSTQPEVQENFAIFKSIVQDLVYFLDKIL